MKITAYILFFLLASHYGQSQNLIKDDTLYKAGIYKTFEEFKFNSPSIVFNYKINIKNKGYGTLGLEGRMDFYRIEIERKVAKSMGNVFGFSDGRNVYINEEYPQLGPRADFSKIQYFGKYCYFEGFAYTVVYTPSGSTTVAEVDEKMIDINSGEVIHLRKKTMRELLANDPKLLEEFNNETQKNKKLKAYAIKYIKTL